MSTGRNTLLDGSTTKGNSMRHQGKKYKAAREQVERGKEYPLAEAVALVKATSTVKFDASVELHMHLGIDPKRAEQIVRVSAVLPHGTGKKRVIAAFTTPAHEKEAKTAGADIVGGEELVKEIQKTGKCNFAIAVATPDFMKQLAPVARILGQKGLMPNPRNETVTTNLQKTISELQGGKLTLRSDDTGNIHALVGKVSLPEASLLANIETVVSAVKRARPTEQKGTYVRSVTITSAMGPGIRVKV